MISAAIAPARLPFAPRPIPTELLSSWLLRVAAANCVELSELLQGLAYRYGRVLSNSPMDYSFPDGAVRALSKFCRIAPEKIRALDLRQRAPHLEPALLLRVQNPLAVLMCPRSNLSRVRYAFCPLCIASQRVIHVHWEWSLACLIRCGVHRTPLLDGCPACGELDPLTFSALRACRLCRSCGSDLAGSAEAPTEPPNKGNIQAVEDAYRAALLSIAPDPTLLGKATHRSFRLFVEEMLEILTRNLNPCSEPHDLSPVVFPRQDIVQIITQLILNAAPSSDQFVRRKRYARGLVLWATLLKMMSEYEAKAIEQASMRWPLPLRQRFASARRYRTQRRWPYTPYRVTMNSCKQFDYDEVAAVYGLSPRPRAQRHAPSV